MDSFEINKIIAAILLTALIVIGIGKFTDVLFHVEKPQESAYKIEGLEVENIQTSCCGMAGSFGYGKDTYEISMKMANERLFPTIENNSNEVIVIADGTSCRCQIKDGLNRKAIHLAKFLDENIIY